MKRAVRAIISGMQQGLAAGKLNNLPKIFQERQYFPPEGFEEEKKIAEQVFLDLSKYRENPNDPCFEGQQEMFEKLETILKSHNPETGEFEQGTFQRRTDCYVCGHKNFYSKASVCYGCLDIYNSPIKEELREKAVSLLRVYKEKKEIQPSK